MLYIKTDAVVNMLSGASVVDSEHHSYIVHEATITWKCAKHNSDL